MSRVSSNLPPEIDVKDIRFRNILTDLIRNTLLNTPTQVEFTIGDLAASDRLVTVQMRNSVGENLAFVFAGVGFISSVSTGVSRTTADGLSGVDEIITSQSFMWSTDGSGSFSVTVTGSSDLYLCIALPNGQIIVSTVLTF